MPSNIDIKIPMPDLTKSAVSRAQGFAGMGGSQRRKASTSASPQSDVSPTGGAPQGNPMAPAGNTFPGGLSMNNMLGFARTPAGQQMIQNILAKLQAGRPGQMR